MLGAYALNESVLCGNGGHGAPVFMIDNEVNDGAAPGCARKGEFNIGYIA